MNEELKRQIKYMWALELWFQDNFWKFSNKKRKEMREIIDSIFNKLSKECNREDLK